MEPEILKLFERYEATFNAAVAGDVDVDEVANLYTNVFIGAAPAGVFTGANDDTLKNAMSAALKRYRAIGTRSMKAADVRILPVDPLHALAHVDWVATYDKDGQEIAIPFTNVYLVRVQDGTAKVFGWITGDEQAEMKKYGIA